MRALLERLRSESAESDCRCTPSFDGERLEVDATDCDGNGTLATSAACRATAIEALAERDAEVVVTRAKGIERSYEGNAAALLVAAGRFVEQAAFHDERLAELAARDPLRAAHDAVGRAGPVSDIAAGTALAEFAAAGEYEEVLRPYTGPTVARSRVVIRPPPRAVFDRRRSLSNGATARIYSFPGRELRHYHLEPVEHGYSPAEYRTLAAAYETLATGGVNGGERAPGRAVRQVARRDDPVTSLESTLRKHTRGYGVLEDLFADPEVSDVFATAPVTENPLRVTVDGESMRTNVRLTERGAKALASRFRRTSGRAFSRASPTLDAVAETDSGERRIRVAGVTNPVSDGIAFAFRSHDAEAWTLPALVANGTLPADAAALLSVAVERDAAGLVAGTRGSGKTTLLGALLWELAPSTRTVLIEDTPELPVAALQQEGRDVQPLRTSSGDGPGLAPVDALRTALRLGEGALVLGEVRGEEARVLYEAMRVGASGSAVLGTIHGDGAAAVRERVVSDLGVAPSAFGTTDLVVTLEPYETAEGRARRVKSIEEVAGRGEDVRFETLYRLDGSELEPTGRIDRGNSRLVEKLAESAESYADVRERLMRREGRFERLVADGRTSAADRVHARVQTSR